VATPVAAPTVDVPASVSTDQSADSSQAASSNDSKHSDNNLPLELGGTAALLSILGIGFVVWRRQTAN
jgi:hypothetical protein